MPGGWLNFQELKRLRIASGISQKKIAKKYGCTLNQYRRIESGDESEIEIYQIEAISELAHCLGVKTGTLVNDYYEQEKRKRK